jgi:hypothetical protein
MVCPIGAPGKEQQNQMTRRRRELRSVADAADNRGADGAMITQK